jgi:hypothetical protein
MREKGGVYSGVTRIRLDIAKFSPPSFHGKLQSSRKESLKPDLWFRKSLSANVFALFRYLKSIAVSAPFPNCRCCDVTGRRHMHMDNNLAADSYEQSARSGHLAREVDEVEHYGDLVAHWIWNGHGRRWNNCKGDPEPLNGSLTYPSDCEVRTSSATADGHDAKRN